jgi:chromate transporter
MSADDRASARERLRELAVVFTRLGLTAFGGPAAPIAMMDHEVVERRRWMTREELVDLLGAANLIPGPNSTELAIHIGHRRAGFAGLLVAGACFIVPAALVTTALAWAYVRFGSVPAVGAVFYGLKPAILAIVIAAVLRLSRTTLRGALAPIAIAAAVASLLGANEIAVLLAGGALGVARRWIARPAEVPKGLASIAIASVPSASAAAVGAASPTATSVLVYFLKIGSVLYGSGYVLLAFLRGGLVEQRHWLGDRQLLDAIAVGQLTPGPVFTTATFVGYLLGGGPGAVAATVGIFLPSFVFVAATHPLVPRMRASRAFAGFLDGVNAAAIGLMAAVVVEIGRGALVGWPAWAIAIVATAAAVGTKVNPTWLMGASAAVGLLATRMR